MWSQTSSYLKMSKLTKSKINKMYKPTSFVIINPNNSKYTKETDNHNTDNTHSKSKSKINNKVTHSLNGNTTKILQINTSNADWSTKQIELITTINNYSADITIISEANNENQ